MYVNGATKIITKIFHPSIKLSVVMPADRLLGTLLRSLQTYTDQQDTPRYQSSVQALLWTVTDDLSDCWAPHRLC